MFVPFLRVRYCVSLPCRVLRLPIHVPAKSRFHSKGDLLQGSAFRKPILRSYGPLRFASTEAMVLHSVIFKISDQHAVYVLQQKLIDLHDMTGLPWWGVIILSTVIVRTVIILPLTVHQHYVNARLQQVDKMMDTTVKEKVTLEIRKLSDENYWSQKEILKKYSSRLLQEKNELISKYNCHAGKNLILMGIQVPIWISMSCAIRNITDMQPIRDAAAQIVYAELKSDSFLWLSDLTLPDTSYCLPIVLGLCNFMNIQVSKMSKIEKHSVLHVIFYGVFRIATLLTIFVATMIPKTIVLYWTTSSLYAVIQNMLLLNPTVRKALRIPVLDNMRKHPLQYFATKWRSFVYFFRY